jgi:hypothetical protein
LYDVTAAKNRISVGLNGKIGMVDASAVPTYHLEVTDDDANSAYVSVKAGGANALAGYRMQNDTNSWYTLIFSNDTYAVYDTAASEYRFGIDASGRVGVMDAATASKWATLSVWDNNGNAYIHVYGGNVGGAAGIVLENDGDSWTNYVNGGSGDRWELYNGSSLFWVATNGDVAGTHATYHTASDERLKTNMHTFDNALDKIRPLEVLYYNWIESERTEADKHGLWIGMSAQRTRRTICEATWINEHGVHSIKWDMISAVAIAGVQELDKRVDANVVRLDAAEAKIARLETEVERLRAA